MPNSPDVGCLSSDSKGKFKHSERQKIKVIQSNFTERADADMNDCQNTFRFTPPCIYFETYSLESEDFYELFRSSQLEKHLKLSMGSKIEATKNRSSFNSSFDNDSDNDIPEDTLASDDIDIDVHIE